MDANLPSLEKVFWKDVKERVSAVNTTIYQIFEQREQDESLYFYIARYPYGSSVLENGMLFLPNSKGKLVPLTDATISKDIQNDLGYNLNSNPVSLVLNNSFEIFLPIETSA